MKIGEVLSNFDEVVIYYPHIARMLGSVSAAILLSQLLHWTDNQENSSGWIRKSYDDLIKEIGFKEEEFTVARVGLKRMGILLEQLEDGSPVVYFKIECEQLQKAWDNFTTNNHSLG